MSNKKTNEFSICLQPTVDVIEKVNILRKLLDESPYRDDLPHITLLRGITSKEWIGDDELHKQMAELTQIEEELPLTSKVVDIVNKSNQFYSDSGILLLTPSDALLSFRRKVIQQLVTNGFTIEEVERANYTPHITVRLGVPLQSETLEAAKVQLLKKTVEFTNWFIYRLELEEGKRKVREVSLEGK